VVLDAKDTALATKFASALILVMMVTLAPTTSAALQATELDATVPPRLVTTETLALKTDASLALDVTSLSL
jgi:hypothetical protein